MTSQTAIRKIEIRIALHGWQWIDTSEMTFESAISTAKKAIADAQSPYGVRISKLTTKWTEEFRGDADFNYIGVG